MREAQSQKTLRSGSEDFAQPLGLCVAINFEVCGPASPLREVCDLSSFTPCLFSLSLIKLKIVKEGYTIKDQSRAHFITATIVDWIDIFSRQNYRDAVINSLSYCIKNKGMILYGYVIMTNHIHLIVQSETGKLSDLIRDFKKFTAKQFLDLLQEKSESRREWILDRMHRATLSHNRNKNYQVWQLGNHAKEIYSEKFLWSKLDYIHFNPVRAGLVAKASDYLYSSASNYTKGNGVLKEVTLADNPLEDVLKSWTIFKYYNY